jgi:hypothetical protein
VLAGSGAILVALALSGCVGGSHPVTSSTAPAPTATTSGTPTATPTAAPTLRPTLSAADNLAFFDATNQKTLASYPDPTGRQLIDGLVAAGFDKKNMLVTADKTTINLTPGSIQFSVKLNGSCLIGQYGGDGVGYHSQVTPVLATGNCLVGETSAINW